jgi:hypothetical protein
VKKPLHRLSAMLHSGDGAAKLLSTNKLTNRKAHFVGAAGHEMPDILWLNPQKSIKQPLNKKDA